MRLDPKRRAELINQFHESIIQILCIGEEIGSKKMLARADELSETFFNRLRKDRNLKKSTSIEQVESEMDDDSADDYWEAQLKEEV